MFSEDDWICCSFLKQHNLPGVQSGILQHNSEKIGRHQSTVRPDDSDWSRDFSEGFVSGIFCQSRSFNPAMSFRSVDLS